MNPNARSGQRPQAATPDQSPRENERRKRPHIAFVGRPKITAGNDGLQLSFDLVNYGEASVSASIDVRFKGRRLELTNPDISLSVGDGPVTLTYSLPAQPGLGRSSRLEIAVVDESGVELAATTNPGGLGLGLASTSATLAKLAMVVVAGVLLQQLFVGDDPEPPPPDPAVQDVEPAVVPPPEPEKPEPPEALPVTYPPEVTLAPAPIDDPRFYPLGQPADAVVELGTPSALGADVAIDTFGVPGGSVVRRPVMVRYEDQVIELGDVTLPEMIPVDFADDAIGRDPWTVASIRADDTEFMTGDPLPATCTLSETGEPIGGYRAVDAGPLTTTFAVSRTADNRLTGSVTVAWAGDGELEYFPEIDQSTLDTINRCAPRLADGASWN